MAKAFGVSLADPEVSAWAQQLAAGARVVIKAGLAHEKDRPKPSDLLP